MKRFHITLAIPTFDQIHINSGSIVQSVCSHESNNM